MPTTQQLRTRLANKLKELFQLDQPDLDFGFYRIMHAKAEQVTTFIENDLLKIVADAFGHLEVQNSQGLLTQAKQRVIDTLGEDAFDAEGNLVAAYRNSPIGKGYLVELAKIEQSKSALSAEADIYDHLYRFFERYYDAGDFISRRYYARETAGKAAPFAVPYNGEEVKLHWANADQYYIKTTEYFANFTFDLRQAKEVNDLRLPLSFGEDEQPRKVHFRIVEATEGEHGNVKAAEATKRFFMIYADNPVERTATGELVINFEYRPDPAKTGAEDTWREKRNAEAVDVVLDKLAALAQADNTMAEYLRLLKISAPTEKDSKRPLLAKYINQYTARNTMDYFIHKDLGSFLRRELDFYIKNEVMRLDDIENAAVSAVETYLAKIKVLRKITGKLIDFLAQLEEFQKKLWLKKKFVVETNYCITLDRVPEELYSEIVANQAQHDEWVRLFAIEDIQGSTITPGYSRQLTIDFLKANNKLLVDTRFFDNAFKTKLVAVAENFDNQISGLLIHSENFQALNFLTEKYRGTFDRVYIDPPYNTDASSIIYKNAYKSSSWLSLIENRLTMASRLMTDEGVLCFAIDDEEVSVARKVLENIFAKEIGVAVVRSNPQSRKAKGTFSPTHEYALFYGNTIDAIPGTLEITEKRLSRYPLQDEKGHYSWMNFIRTGNNDRRVDRPKLYYPIFVDEQDNFRIPQMEWSDDAGEYVLLETPDANEVAVYPVAESGNLIIEKRWHRGHNRVLSEPEEYRVRRDAQGKINIDFKTRIDESSTPVTWWDKNEYASANYGAAELKALFGEKPFDFPKAKKLVEDCIRASGFGSNIIDFFCRLRNLRTCGY